MTPEQAYAEAQRDHAQGVRALQAAGPVMLDSWRMVIESLNGLVKVAVDLGWPEQMARQLVISQYEANLRLAQTVVQPRPGQG